MVPVLVMRWPVPVLAICAFGYQHIYLSSLGSYILTGLLLLFVWPPVGGGFLLLADPTGQPPNESLCWSTVRTTFSHKPTLHTHHTRCKRYRLMSDAHMLTPVASVSHEPTLNTHF
jgi:hypothetical protein